MDDDDQRRLLARISALLARYGGAALAGAPAETAAYRWLSHGFADVEDVEDWLAARCFDPESARDMADLGVTPEQASKRTRDGAGESYIDTIAYKVSMKQLSARQGAARAASSR